MTSWVRKGIGPIVLVSLLGLAGPEARSAEEREFEPEAAQGMDGSVYFIGVGDILEISVWDNPELKVTVPVRPDGRISLPLLGDVKAMGWTPEDLRATLATRFRYYVTSPEVAVVITEIHSRVFFIAGEVREPGMFDLGHRTKLMQAIAMAGGWTAYARKDKVIVLRESGGEDERFELSLKGIVSGRQLRDNILLQPGDTVIVP